MQSDMTEIIDTIEGSFLRQNRESLGGGIGMSGDDPYQEKREAEALR